MKLRQQQEAIESLAHWLGRKREKKKKNRSLISKII